MDSKVWLVVMLLALAVVVESSFDDSHWGLSHPSSTDGDLLSMHTCNGRVGDCISDEEEHMIGSEADRRQLAARKRYIGYDSLKKNNVPCAQRGSSYYNCRGNKQANPYNRGCTVITRCARYLG